MSSPQLGSYVPPWVRRLDPLAVGCCVVALVVYVLHGFDGLLKRDFAVYSYGGQQVVDGFLPYVPILNRAGPLAHLVPAGGVGAARIGGFDDLLGIRIEFMLLSVACVALAYFLGRDTFGSRLTGVASAAALLSFEGFTEFATYGPREKTAMVMFLLAAMLAMVHRRWATTGVFIALATLTWQPVFFPAIVGAVLAIALGAEQGRIRAVCRLAVGGLVPSAIVVAVYALAGDLKLFVDDFFLINLRYTDQAGFFAGTSRSWRSLQEGFGVSVWFLLAGMAGLLLVAVVLCARRSSRRLVVTRRVAPQAALLLVGILWTARAYDKWPDIYVLLPSAALGVGSLAYAVSALVPRRVAVVATVAWVVAATGVAVGYSVGARDHGLDAQRASVEAARELLPADATYVSIEAPQPLVLGRERALNRVQLFGNGLRGYMNDTYPGGMAGYGRWIARQQPTVIAVRPGVPIGFLRPTLEDDYRPVGKAPKWRWYVNRSVGKQTLDALKEALEDPGTAVEG